MLRGGGKRESGGASGRGGPPALGGGGGMPVQKNKQSMRVTWTCRPS